ncbi:MAG TPA: helix-turn-helix domain-containing protein [Acidimicrobiales bacterium]|nr:helix-turn-helix domain-containing protein [Acidimicrobiales bacterium]
MGAHLTVEQRRHVRQLRSDGMRVAEVAKEVGCSLRTVKRVVAGQGKREERTTRWSPGPRRLSLQEREEISIGLRRGDSFSAIGRQLGRSTSTVSREVKANGGRDGYRAWRAHDRAYFEARRPKGAKLECPRLAGQVVEWLEGWWSPEEIARRLAIEFPDDPMMRVSHETIYQSIYVQGRASWGVSWPVACAHVGTSSQKGPEGTDVLVQGQLPGRGQALGPLGQAHTTIRPAGKVVGHQPHEGIILEPGDRLVDPSQIVTMDARKCRGTSSKLPSGAIGWTRLGRSPGRPTTAPPRPPALGATRRRRRWPPADGIGRLDPRDWADASSSWSSSRWSSTSSMSSRTRGSSPSVWGTTLVT